jgi:hypothetical protein
VPADRTTDTEGSPTNAAISPAQKTLLALKDPKMLAQKGFFGVQWQRFLSP